MKINEDQQQLDLAAIYIEMNDQENAKKDPINLVKNLIAIKLKNEAKQPIKQNKLIVRLALQLNTMVQIFLVFRGKKMHHLQFKRK